MLALFGKGLPMPSCLFCYFKYSILSLYSIFRIRFFDGFTASFLLK
ncbi:hypothetical protein LEP1GSC072_0184 [Leptospira noguchii str. Bonito]|nr:hypothetical protein LEP1GSC072_0184 [Leptospira noguchii str. Bonito]